MFSGGSNNPQWDGRFNGEMQPAGVYFYHLKYRCAEGALYEKQGDVTLVR